MIELILLAILIFIGILWFRNLSDNSNKEDNQDVEKEIVYVTGCLLNDDNFFKEGSVEDLNRQLVEICNDIDDNQETILDCNERIRVLQKEKEILEV